MSAVKFGFMGVGNMGGALARAVCRASGGDSVTVGDRDTARAMALSRELSCTQSEVKDIARCAEYIFLGVKPQVMGVLLAEISPVLKGRTDRFVLVTMAAGIEIASITEMLGFECPIIRIMPNTPVSVGKGMLLYTAGAAVSKQEKEELCTALSCAGRLDEIDEALIDAASAVSGCGPAFVCLFAEAMADAGVACGLPRAKALEYAAQTLLGTAELLLETEKHPAVLKDEVCSPAGSTIEGVRALEQGGFRAAAFNAVTAAYDRTRKLGK